MKNIPVRNFVNFKVIIKFLIVKNTAKLRTFSVASIKMPSTRKKALKEANKGIQAINPNPAAMDAAGIHEEETAYECLLRKVDERKRKLADEVNQLESEINKPAVKASKRGKASAKLKQSDKGLSNAKQAKEKCADRATAQFIDEDNIVEMEVEGIHNEFLSKDEMEEGQIKPSSSSNNNATILNETEQVQGHVHDNAINKNIERPGTVEFAPRREGNSQKLEQSVAMLQNFLIKKGLMSEEDLAELLEGEAEQIPKAMTQNSHEK